MAKIKKIKKIEPRIKEIKPISKKEFSDLEEEIHEGDVENFVNFIKHDENSNSTLEQQETTSPQRLTRILPTTKEDEEEINFRPSYISGGSPYETQKYDSGADSRISDSIIGEGAFGAKDLDRQNQLVARTEMPSDFGSSTGIGERAEERAYISSANQQKERKELTGA